MKITKRSNRRLPSPLEFSFYLFAVIAFCVINWTLLKAIKPEQRAPKSFESMVVEAMLDELSPVTLPEDKMLTINQTSNLEPWMLNYGVFSLFDTESEINLEDWMINTSTWSAH